MILFYILLNLISSINSGHIYSQELLITYQNKNFATNFTLIFALQNPISSTDYIKIKFPWSIGNSQSASLYNLNTGKTTVKKNVTGSNDDYNQYYWNFDSSLEKDTWYQLEITANADEQTEGFQQIIEFATQSSISNPIIYDENKVFGIFALAPSPNEEMIVSLHFPLDSEDTRRDLGSSYDIYFDVTPKLQNVSSGVTIILSLENDDYQFIGSCESDSQYCDETLKELDEDYYNYCKTNISKVLKSNCQLATASADSTKFTKIIFEHQSFLEVGVMFRIKGTIQNPGFVGTGSDIKVLVLSRLTNLILEKTVATSVNKIEQTKVNLNSYITYFWGLKEDDTSPCPISLYKKKSGGIIYPYNNIHFTFSLEKSTISGQMLSVQIDVPSATSVLPGSIVVDLPNFESLQIRCYFDTSGTIPIIKCVNVGSLVKSTEYVVCAKVLLDSSTPAEITGFGVVMIVNDFGSSILQLSKTNSNILCYLFICFFSGIYSQSNRKR